MKESRKWDKFMEYLRIEIGIEYKASLYFFCIMVFYCSYLLLKGIYTASILYMAEMIASTYIMGYLQVFFLGNFDEAENLGIRETAYMCVCAMLYALISYLLGWFDRNVTVTVVFAAFFLFAYVCVLIINKIRRNMDTRQLNEMLAAYKAGTEEEKLSGEMSGKGAVHAKRD